MLSYRKFVEWLNRPLNQLNTLMRQQMENHGFKTKAQKRQNIYQFPTVHASPTVKNSKESQEVSKKKKSA